ncbi:hypothetical protein DPMN_189929 [Dreissena polymorpha]|uniref:Uncharacterized protein n=1 Tax=Dreissena polymorpha TaxID=45954 RepID=A0A9D4DWC6_DREPO|nr:hypothetical protein DPMN_189929 [Dreissena polymorpha]
MTLVEPEPEFAFCVDLVHRRGPLCDKTIHYNRKCFGPRKGNYCATVASFYRCIGLTRLKINIPSPNLVLRKASESRPIESAPGFIGDLPVCVYTGFGPFHRNKVSSQEVKERMSDASSAPHPRTQMLLSVRGVSAVATGPPCLFWSTASRAATYLSSDCGAMPTYWDKLASPLFPISTCSLRPARTETLP